MFPEESVNCGDTWLTLTDPVGTNGCGTSLVIVDAVGAYVVWLVDKPDPRALPAAEANADPSTF